MALRAAITWVLVVAGACSAGDPATDDGPPAVDIGVGEDSWQPLTDGDLVELHLGTQGGQHMTGNARIHGLWPGERDDATDAPRVGYTVVGEDGVTWSADLRPMRLPFVASEAGGFELQGGCTIFMVDGADALDGLRVLMRVDVEDTFGAHSSDARWIRVRVIADY